MTAARAAAAGCAADFFQHISHTCAKKEIIMTKALFLTVLACCLVFSPKLLDALRSLPDSNDDFGLC
jgi:hypothetical protein